jgi:hypothetical protein
MATSNSRQGYSTRKTTWRKLGLEWAPGEILDIVQSLMKVLDRSTATLWEFNETCMLEEPLYGHISDTDLGLVHDEARLYSGRITLEELK